MLPSAPALLVTPPLSEGMLLHLHRDTHPAAPLALLIPTREQHLRIGQLLAAHSTEPRLALLHCPDPADSATLEKITALRSASHRLLLLSPDPPENAGGPVTRLFPGAPDLARTLGLPLIPLFPATPSFGSFHPTPPPEPGLPPAPTPFTFHPAPAIDPLEASEDTLRAALMALGATVFQSHPDTRQHLAYACLKGILARRSLPLFTDTHAENAPLLPGSSLLAVSLALAAWIRRNIPQTRVGLVLPPGPGAFIANLAVLFAAKIPVNLNFTIGPAAVRSSIENAGIAHTITADVLADRLKDFPWTDHRHDLPTILKTLPKFTLALWKAAATFLPAPLLATLARIPTQGGDTEAALLFTSGSSGTPKGVPLTHRNILGNIAQIQTILPPSQFHTILASLPIFHSFGFTVTLWWPIVCGPRALTFPSALETGRILKAIHQHQAHLVITTPTFLRAYLKKGTPELLASVKMIVTGAEKLPRELAAAIEEKLHVQVCEGYGMTEATPVIATNLIPPTPAAATSGGTWKRPGTVGRPLPGIAVRVRDPHSTALLPLSTTGLLEYHGVNIFPGYLNDPKRTAEVLTSDAWYASGDLGHLDPDGYLTIEGRLSRFSKVAGEMIPHGLVEQKLALALGVADTDLPQVFVTGLPDPQRGEAIVALIVRTLPADLPAIRAAFQQMGLPNLWTPRQLIPVDAIPMLGTGKLDLAAAKKLAEQAATDS